MTEAGARRSTWRSGLLVGLACVTLAGLLSACNGRYLHAHRVALAGPVIVTPAAFKVVHVQRHRRRRVVMVGR